jgi:hypothetical protein
MALIHRNNLTSLALAIVALAACLACKPADEPAKSKVLSAEDRKLLDGLIEQFLFDPRGAQRVVVKSVERSVWASSAEVERAAWLVPEKEGKPARIYFIDQTAFTAPAEKDIKKLDFVAAYKARVANVPAPAKDDDSDQAFRRMRRNAVGTAEESDLVLAAWLHRLGHDDLAAGALARAQKDKQATTAELRKGLAWSAFAGMVHAYMVRADEEVLLHGERLLKLYAEEAKDEEYQQASAIVAELKRRQKKGTFGKRPADRWPDGFEKWDTAKKVAFLLDALDEVDARQWSQPGGVDLASDRRVQALIAIGDPAVPALIDAVEKDDRLTRSVHFWRDFARSRTVLEVREAALTSVMSNLRVNVFEPVSTGDNFTARGKKGRQEVTEKLRAYWKEYGGIPFDARMMKVLTNPMASVEATREAAYNLAHLGEEETRGTTVWTGDRQGERTGPNPAVAKFSKPTVAEAILAAMDRDLAAHDGSLRDYERPHIEDSYLSSLTALGDKRIVPQLVKRAEKASSNRMRRKWAYACHWLGEPKPLKDFADAFRAGNVVLPQNNQPNTNDDDQPGNVELGGIVGYLASAGTPEADSALYALAEPSHPAHQLAAHMIFSKNPDSLENHVWFEHPFCLAVLRKGLDNERPTGATFKIEKDSLKRVEKDGWGSRGIPEILKDPAVRKEEAPERVCDQAAERVGQLVFGQPAYHPLFKDASTRLEALKKSLDQFQGRFRRMSGLEIHALEIHSWNALFVPDLRPLGRPATVEDVKTGHAIFHLDGKGELGAEKLPAVAVLKKDEKKEQSPRVLIVQTEVDTDGTMIYGVIAKHGLLRVGGRDVTAIKPLGQKKE